MLGRRGFIERQADPEFNMTERLNVSKISTLARFEDVVICYLDFVLITFPDVASM